MKAPPRPNPLTDELSDEAKTALAQVFALLRKQFGAARDPSLAPDRRQRRGYERRQPATRRGW